MLDGLVFIFQFSFYLILFGFLPLMLLIRILSILNSKNPVWHRVLVVLDITSLSYFIFNDAVTKYQKLYNILLYVFCGLSVLTLLYGLHMYI